jgi:hypothetical protein
MSTQENDRAMVVGQPAKNYQIQPSKERVKRKRKIKCVQETTTAVDGLLICV